jgi:putative protein-disulfide isomerase
MPVEARYYTDPACPWSWGSEPKLRRLIWEFGDGLRFTFVMGGLARSYGPAYRDWESGVGSGPDCFADLMAQWLEVTGESGMPTDPRIWTGNPIGSTYPACQAVKAAAEQGPEAAHRYLRRLREGLMTERKKLDHTEALVGEAGPAGLDVERFRIDLGSHAITEAFAADLERTAALGEGFDGPVPRSSRAAGGAPLPTLVFAGEGGEGRRIAGLQPYAAYREAAVDAGVEPREPGPLAVEEALARFGRVTTREVELLCELPGPRAGVALFGLAEQWRVRPLRKLTGYLWEAVESA